jgi:3-phenylpropionate/trans-cinnamate dioxygenase ferredoxin reductase component
VTPDRADVLIVGTGLAGARCAEAWRALGGQGRVIVLGDDPHPPYERPALSKAALTDGHGDDELRLRPDAFWASRGIELVPVTRVEVLDLDGRVAVAGSRRVRFERLVLATGLRARWLPTIPPAPGVHVLRTLDDAEALRCDVRPGRRLAVVGAGFVGFEVASSACVLGARVTVIDPAATPFSATLGPELGDRLAARAGAYGVDLRLGRGVSGIERGADGRACAVVLDDGTRCPCDAVVVGVGAVPNTELVQGQLPLADDGGVATDAVGRTNVPGVFACGDVASRRRDDAPGTLRLEHWSAAATSARVVASTMAGAPVPDGGPPFFWSDQFGWRLQAVGLPSGHRDTEVVGDEDGLVAHYRDDDGRLVGAVVVNRPEALAAARRELLATVVASPPARRPIRL